MFVIEEGQGFEGVVSSLHHPDKDIDQHFKESHDYASLEHTQGAKANENIHMDEGGELYYDHQESDEANQEEMDYVNQMDYANQMDDYQEHHTMGGSLHDPNIQEYQAMHPDDHYEEAQMQRTGRSGRSAADGKEANSRMTRSKFEVGDTREVHENMGNLKQIVSGRKNILQLTKDGFAFTFGSGEFSVSGHGGSSDVRKPQILKHLSDKRVVQIA